VARYYYQQGQIIDFLRYDPGIKIAAGILQNDKAYRKLLSPKK
jgi:hypothetical protein